MTYKIGKYEYNDVILVNERSNNLKELFDFLNSKEFDTIVINEHANEEEFGLFKEIASKVKHNILIKDTFQENNMNVIEFESEDYFLDKENESFNQEKLFEDLFEILSAKVRMEKENDNKFSYRFIKQNIIQSFKEELALEKLFPSLCYDKEVNNKKVLFLDSNYLHNFGTNKYIERKNKNTLSNDAKRFFNVYLCKEITFLILNT